MPGRRLAPDGKIKFRLGRKRKSPLSFFANQAVLNAAHDGCRLFRTLDFGFYHFCRIHKTLSVTPATAAGLSDTVWDMDGVVGMMDAVADKPNRPAGYNQAATERDHFKLRHYRPD